MTETFAETIAAVAPVVLLVAVVELNNARVRIREGRERLAERLETLRTLYPDDAALTDEEAAAAVGNLNELHRQTLRDSAVQYYFLFSGLVAMMLTMAELLALRSLALQPRGPQELEATFCLFATVFSFMWVAFPPVFALLNASTRELLLRRQVTSVRKHITRLVDHRSDDVAGR